MTPVVVDTDVISFQIKSHTLASVYKPYLTDHIVLISFMTLAELEQWSLLANWGQPRHERMEAQLAPFTVIPSGADLCRLWAQVMVSARSAGRPIEAADAWVAATALLYDVPLITHNRSDYLGVRGLTLISHA
jgi:tRNA(fMet)-specific endonuclease VapC